MMIVIGAGDGAARLIKDLQLLLERVCADHEDVGGKDVVLRVQGEVDEVRGLMRDNIDQMLVNTDKLSELRGKADEMAGVSSSFYGAARANRKKVEWESLKHRAMIAAGGGSVFLFFTWPLFFGS